MTSRYFKLFGLMLLFAVYLSYALTFLTAYFHPQRAVVVAIDDYGEATMEFLITIVLGFPLVLYTIGSTTKMLIEPRRRTRRA